MAIAAAESTLFYSGVVSSSLVWCGLACFTLPEPLQYLKVITSRRNTRRDGAFSLGVATMRNAINTYIMVRVRAEGRGGGINQSLGGEGGKGVLDANE